MNLFQDLRTIVYMHGLNNAVNVFISTLSGNKPVICVWVKLVYTACFTIEIVFCQLNQFARSVLSKVNWLLSIAKPVAFLQIFNWRKHTLGSVSKDFVAEVLVVLSLTHAATISGSGIDRSGSFLVFGRWHVLLLLVVDETLAKFRRPILSIASLVPLILNLFVG